MPQIRGWRRRFGGSENVNHSQTPVDSLPLPSPLGRRAASVIPVNTFGLVEHSITHETLTGAADSAHLLDVIKGRRSIILIELE